MLMNKFTAFEDAAMLNMHGLSNTARAAVEGGGRIKRGEWKGK